MLAGLILAGGQGKRLGGRDKALVLLHGRPLIAHLLDRMSAARPQQIALSANGDPQRFSAFGLPVLPDHFPDKGPLAGVHAGLVWAENLGATTLLTASVDCPFLPADFAERLLAARGTDLTRPVYARAGGRDHPTMALWPVTPLLAPLKTHLASDASPRLLDFLIRCGGGHADFGDCPGFANINTPDDLARAEALR